MCQIGEYKRMLNVEPLQAPVPVPGSPESEPEPVSVPVYVEAQEPTLEEVPVNKNQ